MENVQCSCKASAMPSLLEHCRAAAEHQGLRIIFNAQPLIIIVDSQQLAREI